MPAIRWGRDKEVEAIEALECHLGGKITRSGLHISKSHPHIGKAPVFLGSFSLLCLFKPEIIIGKKVNFQNQFLNYLIFDWCLNFHLLAALKLDANNEKF